MLLPNTKSLLEEHQTSEQGVSVFSPIDDVDEEILAGALSDGGGALALSPWTGGRGGGEERNVLLTPGTDTAWQWVPYSDPSNPGHWDTHEAQQYLVSGAYDASDPRQVLPEDVNRVVEVGGDLNGDGINDLAYLTAHGVYLVLTDDTGTTINNYHPPVLLSDEILDVTDLVSLDYNNDGTPDLVVLTADENTANRIYFGDPTDPTMENLARDFHDPTTPVGGLRYVPLGGHTVDPATGVRTELNKLKGTRVEAFDSTGDGVKDSFVVITDQTGKADELYLQDSLERIEIPGSSASLTKDVATARINSDPDEAVTIVFGKQNAVNTYVEIPTDPTGVAYKDLTLFTDIASVDYPTYEPEFAAVTDMDPTQSHDTHTVKFFKTDDHVYNGGTIGTSSSFHIYEGFTAVLDTATPSTNTHTGNYYHDLSTNDRTNIDAATSDPALQQVVKMEIMVLEEYSPPSVVLLTAGGSKMVLTSHLPPATSPFDPPVYDGRVGSGTQNANLDVTLLDAGGSVRTGAETQTSSNVARDLKASHGLLVVADFDGSGYPDVLSGVHVVLSDAGLFKASATNPPASNEPKKWWQGPAPLAVVAIDVDGDSDMDLLALTHEGRLVAVLNDGKGQFDTLTNKRLTGGVQTGATFDKVDVGGLEARDPSTSPRMIKFNNGVAIATESGLFHVTLASPSTTSEKLLLASVTKKLDGLTILDMKTSNLNGQPGANADDLVVLTGDGKVHRIKHDGSVTTLPTVAGMTNPQRLGIGNILGDPPRGTGSLHGLVNNAGAVDDPSQVDPRSADIVVSSDSQVYVLPGASYDPSSPTWSSDGTTWVPIHTFAAVRTINALEVADMDGNGKLSPTAPTPFSNQHPAPIPNQVWQTSSLGFKTTRVPSTGRSCTPRRPCSTIRVHPGAQPTRAPTVLSSEARVAS